MSGVLNGVKNARGMPAISAARSIIYRPDSGLPFQLYFDVLNKDIYVDQENGWELFTSGPGKYTFGSGLTNTDGTVTNDLTTGKSTPQTLAGLQSSTGSGLGLNIFANGFLGSIGDTYIQFFAENDNYACFFQKTGAWNFGGQIDPSLTTPYYYQFLQRGNFLAQIDFNAAIKLNATTGSHIQSLWQANAPTGNASQTHLFFDSVGSPSFRIGTNNWFKFTPNTLTANRNYALQDSNYILAGIDIAQTFSALQTFSAGATFGAAINATAGSAAANAINFGTSGFGLNGTSTSVNIAVAGSNKFTIDSINGITMTTSMSIGGNFISYSGARIQGGANTPEGAITAPVGSLFLRTNGGANTTLYVKESGTGNTGWVAK